MATLIDLSNATNVTNIYDMAVQLNGTTGGSVGLLILATGFFITLVSLKNWDNKDAFAVTGYSWSIFAFLFFLADLIGVFVLMFFWFFGVLGLVGIMLRD